MHHLSKWHHLNRNHWHGLTEIASSYKNEDLKLVGTLKEKQIALSFVEVETEEIISLKPLPCNPRQIENFLKNERRISILWGLVHPENGKDIIIPIPDDGVPPSQIIIKGFELVKHSG